MWCNMANGCMMWTVASPVLNGRTTGWIIVPNGVCVEPAADLARAKVVLEIASGNPSSLICFSSADLAVMLTYEDLPRALSLAFLEESVMKKLLQFTGLPACLSRAKNKVMAN